MGAEVLHDTCDSVEVEKSKMKAMINYLSDVHEVAILYPKMRRIQNLAVVQIYGFRLKHF